jgi:lysophospholipase L1-like esterase
MEFEGMFIRKNSVKALILLLCFATFAVADNSQPKCDNGFFLRDGDVYVIYGDSITDCSVYPRLLENYVLTRFPSWNITFYNFGWGCDMAGNIFRVQRDVLHIKPTVFTENMGMNDGYYIPINAKNIELYTNAYRTLIPMLRKCNPDMRIALISTVPYENQPDKHLADGAYPQTLRYLARTKKQIAQEFNLSFIDLFTGYGTKLGFGKIVYPDFILSGDGIHPNPIGQSIMGLAILKGMNAPAEIATLNLEVVDKIIKSTQTSRCKIKDLKLSPEGLISFQRLAEALPCPVEPQGEQAGRFLEIVDFANEINRDMLKVTGLTGKVYELKINESPIATYTAAELSNGVNIAEPMKGPLWDQAMAVAQATLNRQNAHFGKWRNVWLKDQSNLTQGEYDLSNKTEIEKLDAQAQAAIKKQHELNQPKWMIFTLTPITEKPMVLPKPITFPESKPVKPAF